MNIIEEYEPLIYTLAKRYHTGSWTLEDVRQELRMLLFEAIKKQTLVPTPKLIKSFLICRAINIVRVEVRKCPLAFDLPQITTQQPNLWETTEIFRVLHKDTDDLHVKIATELTSPSPETITNAMIRRSQALNDTTRLRMKHKKLYIEPKDIQKTLGISKATFSRCLKRIRLSCLIYLIT